MDLHADFVLFVRRLDALVNGRRDFFLAARVYAKFKVSHLVVEAVNVVDDRQHPGRQRSRARDGRCKRQAAQSGR